MCGAEIPIDSEASVNQNWHKLILEPIPLLDKSYAKSIDVCKDCAELIRMLLMDSWKILTSDELNDNFLARFSRLVGDKWFKDRNKEFKAHEH